MGLCSTGDVPVLALGGREEQNGHDSVIVLFPAFRVFLVFGTGSPLGIHNQGPEVRDVLNKFAAEVE